MVFGKKKLKPSQLAPPPPKEPAKTPDKPVAKAAPPAKATGKKRPAEPQPTEKPRGLIEPLEDRQHI